MSEANKRRIYTKEFKQDALNLSKQPGYTIAIAANSLGIPECLLYRWRRESGNRGVLAFPGNGKEAITDKDQRIRELEKQNKDFELENAILKKAVGIFSRVPK
jgi:transposase-like protein